MGLALVRVRVYDLGWIAFYESEKGGYFVARCRCPAHRDALPCRTSRVSYIGRKPGQGRPLGWLMCWLKLGTPDCTGFPPSRSLHVVPEESFVPDQSTRDAARRELMEIPGAEGLFSQEWLGEDADPLEPPHFR